MARFEISGVSELNEMLSKLSDVPEETIDDILTAMGNEAIKHIQESGRTCGVYDPDWSGTHVLDSLSLGKPQRENKGIATVKISFKGTRKRGNTTTSNGRIAYINEFGANNKGIAPRQFVRIVKETKGDDIFAAGERVFHNYLDSLDF